MYGKMPAKRSKIKKNALKLYIMHKNRHFKNRKFYENNT